MSIRLVQAVRRLSTPAQFARSKLRTDRRVLHPSFADAIYSQNHALRAGSTEEAVNNILYNTPAASRAPVHRHVLNCLVSNEPGVLSRVAGVLAGRGFNIDSLVVARTEVSDLSRMTIVINGQDGVVEQARRQLEDIVPVWAVLDYTHSRIVERELLLVKVAAIPPEHLSVVGSKERNGRGAEEGEGEGTEGAEEVNEVEEVRDEMKYSPTPGGVSPLVASSLHRKAIIELAHLFKGRIVDLSIDSITVELSAKSERIDAFLKLIQPYGIIEAARSGTMAMPRAKVEGLFSSIDPEAEDAEPEADAGAVDATLLPPG